MPISRVFREDIEQTVNSPEIPWREMEGSTVLVTGATGLIGEALVRVLAAGNTRYALGLRIIAHGRNKAKGNMLSQECDAEFIAGDIRSPLPDGLRSETDSYVFHCAAVTKSAMMVAKPIETMMTSLDGTRNVLEWSRCNRMKSIVFLSSMEVYWQSNSNEMRETDMGYLDLRNPRTCYPESKRLCENMCACYAAEYGVSVKIARLAQTFGAGSPKNDTRIFAQFARSVVNGENIILHTNGMSRGNYCYTSDAIMGLLIILLKGAAETYNIANPASSMTIYEMAEAVASKVCGGKISVETRISQGLTERAYSPHVGYRLNINKLKDLGWQPRYGLLDMYRRMIADWQENET